jgi:hypothetical protein
MMQEKLEALRAVLALAKAGWTSREGNVSLPPPFDVVQRVIDDQLVDFRRQIGFKIGAGNALNFPSHDSDNVSRPERTGKGGLKQKLR